MISSGTPGLAAQRQERIRRLLQERHAARVEEFARDLGVSAATVRRDLVDLDRRGWLRRVHGGAVSVEGRPDEPGFEDKAALAAGEKQRIAEAALRFVKPNDAIFLDGGSTVLALARLLADRSGLTVVTNSLRVAAALSGSGPRMIVIGGELRRLSQTFVGEMTRASIEPLHVDTAFMGTIGLSATGGLTTTDPREAYTKELMMSRADRVVLLADSRKIGAVSFVRFAGIEDVDVLITDSGAARAALSAFRRKRVRVLVETRNGRPEPSAD